MKEDNYYLKPKKSLGQHFLRSEKALNTIVENISQTNFVFEIGPGEGVLTEKLLNKGYTVCVVEIDRRSIELLKEKFKKEIEANKLYILEKDCLEVDYQEEIKRFNEKEYSLVGNIPYYITGAIFRKSLEQRLLPKEIIFLVQKEVAQRIMANDGKESLLSVSIKIFSEQVKILEIVKRGSFVPPPKVDSAIIGIKNIVKPFKDKAHEEIFFKVLKAAFSQKRKFLLANLKNRLDTEVFEKYFEDIKGDIVVYNGEKARAEDVSMDTWREILKKL